MRSPHPHPRGTLKLFHVCSKVKYQIPVCVELSPRAGFCMLRHVHSSAVWPSGCIMSFRISICSVDPPWWTIGSPLHPSPASGPGLAFPFHGRGEHGRGRETLSAGAKLCRPACCTRHQLRLLTRSMRYPYWASYHDMMQQPTSRLSVKRPIVRQFLIHSSKWPTAEASWVPPSRHNLLIPDKVEE